MPKSENEVLEAINAEASAELSEGELEAVAGGTKAQVQEITIKKYFDKTTSTLLSS